MQETDYILDFGRIVSKNFGVGIRDQEGDSFSYVLTILEKYMMYRDLKVANFAVRKRGFSPGVENGLEEYGFACLEIYLEQFRGTTSALKDLKLFVDAILFQKF